MAVMINEVEVTVADAQAQQVRGQPPAGAEQQQAAGGKMSPQDLADVWRHQAMRMARVRAH